jgi:hypothetical protein
MLSVASHWKATIQIYSLKNFQNIKKFIAFSLPKNAMSRFGSLGPLGIKIQTLWLV